jgi:hypothetical protein
MVGSSIVPFNLSDLRLNPQEQDGQASERPIAEPIAGPTANSFPLTAAATAARAEPPAPPNAYRPFQLPVAMEVDETAPTTTLAADPIVEPIAGQEQLDATQPVPTAENEHQNDTSMPTTDVAMDSAVAPATDADNEQAVVVTRDDEQIPDTPASPDPIVTDDDDNTPFAGSPKQQAALTAMFGGGDEEEDADIAAVANAVSEHEDDPDADMGEVPVNIDDPDGDMEDDPEADMEEVPINVDAMPLAEIQAFKEEHQDGQEA